jgi:hypothetical protein
MHDSSIRTSHFALLENGVQSVCEGNKDMFVEVFSCWIDFLPLANTSLGISHADLCIFVHAARSLAAAVALYGVYQRRAHVYVALYHEVCSQTRPLVSRDNGSGAARGSTIAAASAPVETRSSWSASWRSLYGAERQDSGEMILILKHTVTVTAHSLVLNPDFCLSQCCEHQLSFKPRTLLLCSTHLKPPNAPRHPTVSPTHS